MAKPSQGIEVPSFFADAGTFSDTKSTPPVERDVPVVSSPRSPVRESGLRFLVALETVALLPLRLIFAIVRLPLDILRHLLWIPLVGGLYLIWVPGQSVIRDAVVRWLPAGDLSLFTVLVSVALTLGVVSVYKALKRFLTAASQLVSLPAPERRLPERKTAERKRPTRGDEGVGAPRKPQKGGNQRLETREDVLACLRQHGFDGAAADVEVIVRAGEEFARVRKELTNSLDEALRHLVARLLTIIRVSGGAAPQTAEMREALHKCLADLRALRLSCEQTLVKVLPQAGSETSVESLLQRLAVERKVVEEIGSVPR